MVNMCFKGFRIPSHGEMQVKIPLRYHLIPIRMAIFKKVRINPGEDLGEEGRLFAAGGTRIAIMKSVWLFLKKLRIDLPDAPAIGLLSIFSKDCIAYHRDICTSMFTAVLVTTARR